MVRQSLWILLATVLFALMAVFVKAAAGFYSIWEIIFYRSIFGVIFCFWILRKKCIPIRTTRPLRHFIRCAIGTTCITLGVYILSVLPLGTAQTFAYSSPLWLCLFLSVSALKSGEKLDFRLLAAVGIGFIGVLIILRPDAPEPGMLFASFMGVLTGLTGGAADFMIRSLTIRREPPERIVFFFTLTGTLAGGIMSLFTGFSPHGTEGVLLLLAIGVTSTLAQIALTVGWAGGHPLLNAVYQFTAIPCAVIFGALLFGEYPDAVALLGISIVTAAGLAASILRMHSEKRAAERRAAAAAETSKACRS